MEARLWDAFIHLCVEHVAPLALSKFKHTLTGFVKLVAKLANSLTWDTFPRFNFEADRALCKTSVLIKDESRFADRAVVSRV